MNFNNLPLINVKFGLERGYSGENATITTC